MKRFLRRALLPARKLAARFVVVPDDRPRPPHIDRDTVIFKAAMLIADEKIEGDYLEFGVFQGRSFVDAYKALHGVFAERVAGDVYNSDEDARRVGELARKMRFFAFDSFEGLPSLDGVDITTDNFSPGKYACSEGAFRENLAQASVPLTSVITIPGWFEETCVDATREDYGITAAAVVHIDCDVYSSAVHVLNFVTPLLRDGTFLIFDDWYCYRGHPERGEQRAFNEWKRGLPGWSFTEFQKEGPFKNSFIANKIG